MDNIFDVAGTAPPPDSSNVYERGARRVRSDKRFYHDDLSSLELVQGKRRLASIVDKAFKTLDEAMDHASYATSVKAAIAVLDRTGFGPKNTVDVNASVVDLSMLTKEQLAERALRVVELIKSRQKMKLLAPIDVPAEDENDLDDADVAETRPEA